MDSTVHSASILVIVHQLCMPGCHACQDKKRSTNYMKMKPKENALGVSDSRKGETPGVLAT